MILIWSLSHDFACRIIIIYFHCLDIDSLARFSRQRWIYLMYKADLTFSCWAKKIDLTEVLSNRGKDKPAVLQNVRKRKQKAHLSV